MTAAQRDKLSQLGGADWVRKRTDKAKAPNTGMAVIAKTYPEGAALALEGDGPIIDTTRQPEPEREAA